MREIKFSNTQVNLVDSGYIKTVDEFMAELKKVKNIELSGVAIKIDIANKTLIVEPKRFL
jgi:hypothetical protein